MKGETIAIHAGTRPDKAYDAVSVPIYQNSTFVFEDVGKTRGYDYSRTANPTRKVEEIIEGMKLLAQTEGIFAEATGGVVIAVLKKLAASGAIKKNELTVTFITAAGPKIQEILSNSVQTLNIKPAIESLEEALAVSALASAKAFLWLFSYHEWRINNEENIP